jgi:hypothetical protein
MAVVKVALSEGHLVSFQRNMVLDFCNLPIDAHRVYGFAPFPVSVISE